MNSATEGMIYEIRVMKKWRKIYWSLHFRVSFGDFSIYTNRIEK